jgi:tetratricopeptide (TPR) repeat protein
MRYFIFLVIILSFNFYLVAQSVDDYVVAINQAEQDGNKNLRLNLLQTALKSYPNNVDLLAKRAHFYNNEGLDSLALDDFLALEQLGYGYSNPDNRFDLYYNLTEIYNRLDRADKGLMYAQRFYNDFPNSETAAASLLWSYQKAFNYSEGLVVGQKILAQFQQSYQINALLSLLATSLFNYTLAKNYALQALKLAQEVGDNNVVLTILYNLYLLEMQFYNFSKAETTLQQANNIAENSAIYRSLGLMYYNKLDYFQAERYLKLSLKAEEEESERYGYGPSPLAYLGLVELYLAFAKPNEALEILTILSSESNLAWLGNYGLNASLYYEELARLTAAAYRQQGKIIKYTPKIGFTNYFVVPLNQLKAQFYHFYFSNKAKSYALNNGKLKQVTDNVLPAYQHYIFASEGYKFQQNYFLKAAAQLEGNFVGKVLPQYKADLALLHKDRVALQQSYHQFDAHYQLRNRAELLQSLIKLSKGKERLNYIEHLYSINPSLTKLYGLPLVLKLNTDGPKADKIKGALANSFNLQKEGDWSYSLIVSFNNGQIELLFTHNGNLIFGQTLNADTSPNSLAVSCDEAIYNI